MKPNKKKKMISDPIKRIGLNGGNGAREIVIQIARALGFKIHEDDKGVSAYGGNSIRLADHCTYMQTWVDNGAWNAPIRLDIVIEDEPTQAITQVKDGYDFTITEFVSPSNTITPQMARMVAYDIRNVMNGNLYGNNIRGEKRNLVATHGNNQENINCNRNMNKKLIRLTESDLHRIVRESVNRVLREAEMPGSISHGTMRNEDVIPRLMSVIFRNNPQKAREIWKSSPNLLQALCDSKCGNPNNWWESEEATEISCDLHDVLQDYAPEGHYFGSHPGNGSDLGFWPNED